jgi:methionyl-tRNA formyltransferase
MLKVVFAGTPEFARVALEAIHVAGHEIVMVMTQPDRPAGRGLQLQASPVKQFALAKRLPVIQPHSLKVSGAYGADAASAIQALHDCDFDVMVVAAYGLILPQEVFAISEQPGRFGCLNIHASLLPRWRGAAPIHRAIEAGDKKTGISIMQMDLGLDTGPVISMKELPIAPNETTETLHDALAGLGATMIVEVLNQIDKEATLTNIPQSEDGVTYAKKILKEESRIHWQDDALSIDSKIRAFNPFPGATFEKEGVLIKVWNSFPVASEKESARLQPGTITAILKEGVQVACGVDQVCMTEIQKPGGKRVQATQLAKSMNWQLGQILQ